MRERVRETPADSRVWPSTSWIAWARAVSTSAEPITFRSLARSSSEISPVAIWGLTMRMSPGRVRPWMTSAPAAMNRAIVSSSARIGACVEIVCAAARVIAPRMPAHTMTLPSRGPSGSFAK